MPTTVFVDKIRGCQRLQLVGCGLSGFGQETTNPAVRNPQSTTAVQMFGSVERAIPIAEFGKTSLDRFRQGTDGLWHVRPPVHGRFAGLSLPWSGGSKRLLLEPGTWWIDPLSSALLCNQKQAQARRSEQAERVNAPFRPLSGTCEIGRPHRHHCQALGSSVITQSAVAAVKAEYAALGMDTTSLQTSTILRHRGL